VVGPWEFDGLAVMLTLKLRRFRCRGCGAIVTSVPRGLLRGFIYGAAAIALALALWAFERRSGVCVRTRVSPWPPGSECWHGWRSLRRWTVSAERLWRWLRLGPDPPRDRALAVVTQLAARAPHAAGPVTGLACFGALRG